MPFSIFAFKKEPFTEKLIVPFCDGMSNLSDDENVISDWNCAVEKFQGKINPIANIVATHVTIVFLPIIVPIPLTQYLY